MSGALGTAGNGGGLMGGGGMSQPLNRGQGKKLLLLHRTEITPR